MKTEGSFGVQCARGVDPVPFKSILDSSELGGIILDEERFQIFDGRPPGCGAADWLAHFMANYEDPGIENLRRQLFGKPLFDLGAGPKQRLHRFAEHVGASSYVTVDKYYDLDPHAAELNGVGLKVPASHRREDMLLFLCSCQSGAGNITMNAIGHKIVVSRAYRQKLALEIARVIPSRGLFLTCNSVVEDYLSDSYFEELPPEDFALQEDLLGQPSLRTFIRK